MKNWKLTLLGLIMVGLLASLGYWQLSRGQEKKLLLESFKSRATAATLNNKDVEPKKDLRFYRTKLTGEFDNKHTLLLDNKTHQGKIGYEVYTPFRAKGVQYSILVDRGFAPIEQDRNTLPIIKAINGNVTIHGMFNIPPNLVALGPMLDAKEISWPLRVEFVDMTQLGKILESNLLPYIVQLEPSSPFTLSASAIDWNIFTVSPERHMAYAFQWFALATTLLIICVVLNRRP